MHRKILTLLFLLLTATASAAQIRQQQIAKRNYCSLRDLLSVNRFSVFQRQKQLLAYGRKQQLRFEFRHRRFFCNGSRVELCFPTAVVQGTPYLSIMDWQKVLRPLLYPATVPKHRVYTICLDMGHGGKDPGALGAFSKEKNLTLIIGRRVAAILRSYGFRVVMTRNSDIQIPLARIPLLQKRSRSDLFVSIHMNSAADRKISGIETYCLSPAGAPSSNGGKVDKRVYPGNRFDANNLLLAWHIQRTLLKTTSAADRGIKRARFAVLKDLSAPGVLVEMGFISNRSEEKLLNRKQYQEKLARGLAIGIINYARSLNRRK